jgi:hypothetical protein
MNRNEVWFVTPNYSLERRRQASEVGWRILRRGKLEAVTDSRVDARHEPQSENRASYRRPRHRRAVPAHVEPERRRVPGINCLVCTRGAWIRASSSKSRGRKPHESLADIHRRFTIRLWSEPNDDDAQKYRAAATSGRPHCSTSRTRCRVRPSSRTTATTRSDAYPHTLTC